MLLVFALMKCVAKLYLVLTCLSSQLCLQQLQVMRKVQIYFGLSLLTVTGKSFSESLILASTNNPQYDKRLFIELQVQYMKITSSEHVVFVLRFRTIYVDSMFSTCFLHVLSLEFSCTELVIQ